MNSDRRQPRTVAHALPVIKGSHSFDASQTLTPVNLLWLTLTLALVAAPHIMRMPVWIGIISAMILGWRLFATYRRKTLPAKWLLVTLGILGALAVYLTFGVIFARESGIALLVLMLCLKLLETHSQRDVTVVVCLAYFLILTGFLYSQSMLAAAYVVILLWIVTATLVGFNHHTNRVTAKQRLWTGGLLVIQGVPLMILLFLFFPRIQGPLWGTPQPTDAARTGLSESMSPGAISKLSASNETAFRVDFAGQMPAQNQLYWRGIVLTDFDGKTWTAGRSGSGKVAYQGLDTPVKYAITLEPHNRRWLFALDLPASVPAESTVLADFQLLARRPVESRMRYEMQSILRYRTPLDPPPAELSRALALPEFSNPQSRLFARNLRKKSTGDAAFVNDVLHFFQRENFVYTLQPPLLGTETVDDFLFVTRRGFCEHYASSFTFLMRAAGVPARVVTGYQGGEVNPVGGYLMVRQADAHAWSEVWLAGQGWVRIDPTSAVAPSRSEQGVQAALPLGESLPFGVRQESGWLKSLRLNLDATTYSWNKWVLGYNTQRQLDFLGRLGVRSADWQSLVTGLALGGGLIMLILIALLLWRLRPADEDQVQKMWLVFGAKLASFGLGRHVSEGPAQYAARLGATYPALAGDIAAISELYIRLRYGPARSDAEIKNLAKLMGEFKARVYKGRRGLSFAQN